MQSRRSIMLPTQPTTSHATNQPSKLEGNSTARRRKQERKKKLKYSHSTPIAHARCKQHLAATLLLALFLSLLHTTPPLPSFNYKSPTAQSDQHYTTTLPLSPHSPTNHTAKAQYVPAPTPTDASHPPYPTCYPHLSRGTAYSNSSSSHDAGSV